MKCILIIFFYCYLHCFFFNIMCVCIARFVIFIHAFIYEVSLLIHIAHGCEVTKHLVLSVAAKSLFLSLLPAYFLWLFFQARIPFPYSRFPVGKPPPYTSAWSPATFVRFFFVFPDCSLWEERGVFFAPNLFVPLWKWKPFLFGKPCSSRALWLKAEIIHYCVKSKQSHGSFDNKKYFRACSDTLRSTGVKIPWIKYDTSSPVPFEIFHPVFPDVDWVLRPLFSIRKYLRIIAHNWEDFDCQKLFHNRYITCGTS